MKEIKEFIKQLFCNHKFVKKYIYLSPTDDYILYCCEKCNKSYIKEVK